MSGKESAADRGTFSISRVIDAPRALVFKAWTDPVHLAKWWGPRMMTIPVAQADARAGGAYRITMREPDGIEYPITGVYREFDPPRRLVMTMDASEHPAEWHDMVKPGRKKSETNPVGIMIATVSFDEAGDKTKLTLQVAFESPAIAANLLKLGMGAGWSESLDRLGELVGRGSTLDREIVTSRLLKAPRELVFAALTDAKHIGEWWGPEGFTSTVHEMDVRPGGKWRITMRGPDGRNYPSESVYLEIVSPERIVFDHNPGNPNDPGRFRSEITLADVVGGTVLILRSRFLTAAERDRADREVHAVEGARQTLARLAKYLSA